MRILSWNLFHGRDAPPNPRLHTWRSRLLGAPERDLTHAQVNRPLLEEFGTVLARDPWQVALLQEAPPRWLRPLASRCGAHGASALTARNECGCLRAWAAERNPDLIASGEGGSNQLLVRPPWRIASVRRLTLTRRPERRRMLWARIEAPGTDPLCVANLHATARDERAAARDLERAAEHALRWSCGAPLVVGGDLNLRPHSAPGAFRRVRERFGLDGTTAPRAVDHLLTRGPARSATERTAAGWRELEVAEGRLRLSDHAAVAVELERDRTDAGLKSSSQHPRGAR